MVALVEQEFQRLLSLTDIKINGHRPWDIQVHDKRLYNRILIGGSMGLGESYVDGWWDCKKLDELFYRFLYAGLDNNFRMNAGIIFRFIKAKLFNLQSKKRSLQIAEKHYNIGNDLFMALLDPYNQYTCGYWRDAKTLNKAQEAKLDLICRKLQLTSKDKVLDIGCGWGGFAKYAAKKYGCHVTGITISEEQIAYAKEYCKELLVTILNCDYRDLEGKFDKVLVCGMIEHVGPKNYRRLFEVIHKCLNNNGLFLLHTIGFAEIKKISDPWIEKYIFPNGYIPDMRNISEAINRLFVMEDWHNFGADYDRTLIAWFNNFEKSWDKLKKHYSERFYRMWKYYLLSCAGAFRARKIQLWQIVLSKKGVPQGYISIR